MPRTIEVIRSRRASDAPTRDGGTPLIDTQVNIKDRCKTPLRSSVGSAPLADLLIQSNIMNGFIFTEAHYEEEHRSLFKGTGYD